MSQPSDMQPERRSEPRRPVAFGFWFRRAGAGEQAGWMLNMCTRGAAFLTAAGDAPCVGERLELAEMHSPNRSVREAAGVLPAQGRVLRVDDPDALTRRVAIQFEEGFPGALERDPDGEARAWRPERRAAAPAERILPAAPWEPGAADERGALRPLTCWPCPRG